MYSGAHHTYNRTSQARQCTRSSREAMQYSSYKRHQPHRTTTTSTRKKINGHKSLRLADKQARGCLSTILPCKSVQNQADALFCPGQPWQKCILELGWPAVLLWWWWYTVLKLLHRGLQNEPDTSSPPPSSVYIQIGHKIKKVQGSNYHA